jgi:WD40 repeat protein
MSMHLREVWSMAEIAGRGNERFHLFISYTTDPDFSCARRLESFLETFHRLSSPVGATEEEDAHVWSMAVGRYRRVQPGKDAWSIDVTPDGRIVALAEAEGSVSLVDVQTGAVTRRNGVHGWRSESIALRPATGEVVSSGRDLNLRLWEPNLERSTVLSIATHLFTSIVFSPDGAMLR